MVKSSMPNSIDVPREPSHDSVSESRTGDLNCSIYPNIRIYRPLQLQLEACHLMCLIGFFSHRDRLAHALRRMPEFRSCPHPKLPLRRPLDCLAGEAAAGEEAVGDRPQTVAKRI